MKKKTSPLYVAEDICEYSEDINYEDIVSQIMAKDIILLIQELSPQYKLVFNLYEMDGYSHAEIAQLLGISENTSRSNLLRAKAVLQQKILKRFPYNRGHNTYNHAK
ncbi:MAG: RNA polymerase sigma factor [Bacteroidetes bacterium ADurb.Bin408]|nr:MAG: RNA polymerase sigma factor [Bacteroidetes bacterium ADurb.Bin408]